MISLLIRFGAKDNVKNDYGKTPYDISQEMICYRGKECGMRADFQMRRRIFFIVKTIAYIILPSFFSVLVYFIFYSN